MTHDDHNKATEAFHKALYDFSHEVARRFQDRFQDDDLDWEVDGQIQANFPWYYIHYSVTGSVAFPALKVLETEYQKFCSEQGAVFEAITISPYTKMDVRVRVKIFKALGMGGSKL